MKKLVLMISLITTLSAFTYAQVRPVGDDTRSTSENVPFAGEMFEAKYEGGMFGYSDKQTGKLKFDDINKRLVFIGKDGKEKFSLPYSAMQVVYPQSKSVTSNTGNVVRHIPLPGSFLGGLIKEKRRYLIINFEDLDVDAVGNINFKVSSKELLDSIIKSLGAKAGMTQRGDAYYRPKVSKTEI